VDIAGDKRRGLHVIAAHIIVAAVVVAALNVGDEPVVDLVGLAPISGLARNLDVVEIVVDLGKDTSGVDLGVSFDVVMRVQPALGRQIHVETHLSSPKFKS
jgi:hypothetical protein